MGKEENIAVQETEMVVTESKQLYADVCELIENTRQRTAVFANTELCMMHWQIGKRINEDVLYHKRAEYGKQIVKNLAKKLTEKYGKGWSDRKLKHCIRTAYTFSEGNTEHIEYLMLEESPIKVAQYYTQLPDKKTLKEKLQRAIAIERLHHAENKKINKN